VKAPIDEARAQVMRKVKIPAIEATTQSKRRPPKKVETMPKAKRTAAMIYGSDLMN
jgi:hypothetical protein